MRRSNPWPAFVDLFAALLIAAFGGLMLLSAAARKPPAERQVTVSRVYEAAELIHKRLRLAISRQKQLGARIRDCGDDTCIDLDVHFRLNSAYILDPAERDALQQMAVDLRAGLDELAQTERTDVEVIVEGHTDHSQVKHIADPREAFLYNWNLSAQRASAVVYEFRTKGLQPPSYKVVAIGYADSQPLCDDESAECAQRNRRTTLRLRIDTRSLEKRLAAQG